MKQTQRHRIISVGSKMEFQYYTKDKLLNADDYLLSFGISKNLVDSSFELIQYPLKLYSKNQKQYYLQPRVEDHEQIVAFQSIVTAIELLLKARIALSDWRLLIADNGKENKRKILEGDFRSINFDRCVTILENKCNINLENYAKDRLEKVRIARNKIAHFYFDIKKEVLDSYISHCFDIYIDFYRTQLKDEIFDSGDRTEDFERDLVELSSFIDTRKQSNLLKFGPIKEFYLGNFRECNECWTYNLSLTQDNLLVCLFCGKEIDIEEYAADNNELNSEPSFCPICRIKTIIGNYKGQEQCIVCGQIK